jgi:hypothetical protein
MERVEESLRSKTVLERYFELLDQRRTDELLAMFDAGGVMITQGGTKGVPLKGQDALRGFYASRGPAVARHVVTSAVENENSCFAEGLVRPLEPGETKFFLASARLDGEGRILRYTTLVWTAVSEEQEEALVAEAP